MKYIYHSFIFIIVWSLITKSYCQSSFPGMCNDFGVSAYATAGLTGSVTVNDVVTISGKHYVVGHISNRGKEEGFALRLNNDFTVDRTFNNGKAWFTNNTGVNETINSVAVTSQGRIVLGGKAGNYGQLYMITATGGFVSSFNSGGTLTLAYLTGISQVLPNGTGVYVFGYATSDLTLLYSTVTATGTWSSFNTPFHTGSSRKIKVLTEASGAKYIAFCQGSTTANIEKPSVLKIKPNGIIDSTFGTNGLYEDPTTGNCTIQNIRFAEDSKLLVGVRTDGFTSGFTLMKILPSGLSDNSWNMTGTGIYNTGGLQQQKLNDFMLDSENNVWVIGEKTVNGVIQPDILKVNSLGDLDHSFTFNTVYPADVNGGVFSKGFLLSGGGYVVAGTFSINGTDKMYLTAMSYPMLAASTTYIPVLQPDVALEAIATGANGFYISSRQISQLPNVQSLYLTRFNSWGFPDNGFGTKGTFVGGTNRPFSYPSIMEDPSGNVWLGGTDTKVTYDNFSILKLTSSGQPDMTFDQDGMVSIHIGPATKSNTLKDMEVLSDGSILTAGQANTDLGSYVHVALAKLKPDGTADLQFGTNGSITHKLTAIHDFVSDMELDEEGNIYITGSAHLGWRKPFVIRLKEDGSLDSTFGTKGVATFTAPDSLLGGIKIKRLKSGNFVILCYSADPGGTITELATLVGMNADGSLNTSFGTNGFFHLGEQADTKVQDPDISVAASGHIVVSGRYLNGNTWAGFIYILDNRGQRTNYNGNGVRLGIALDLESNHLLVRDYRILLAVDRTYQGSNPGAVCMDHEGIFNMVLGTTNASHDQGKTDIVVYPNPATDVLYVNKEIEYAEIKDMLGKTVIHCKVSKDAPIDINMLKPGIYTIKLGNLDKAIRFVKK